MYRRLGWIAVIFTVLAGGLVTAPGRRAVEGALLLRDLGTSTASANTQPAELERLRQAIDFTANGRSYRADLYGAGEAPRSLLLLVPGLAPDGRNDRRLVDLAVTLAKAHFAVLVPDLGSLRDQRVSADNVRQIADALGYLAGRSDIAGKTPPLGTAAISYAVGPALLATLDPALTGKVDFMVGIGGYYDVTTVVTYFTTGYYRSEVDGTWVKGAPNLYGKWLFVNANTDAVMDMRDRITLRAMARRRMADPDADIDDLAPLLGREGRAVHILLANADPDAVGRLIAALPDRLRTSLRALDLKGRDLAGAPRSVILIHGRDDHIIPVVESMNLNAALPAERTHLYIADHLAHADLEPGDWLDILTLWQAAYRLLKLRDGVD